MLPKPAVAYLCRATLSLASLILCSLPASAAALERPKSGPVEILKASEVKPGMHAIAWTVFEGTEPIAVPIEIIGAMKNMWGPGQDVIIGKMGGRAERTNVAAGMSGSPVYIDGKLIGAVALRLSTFSPDAICGITPIELMLEINKLDDSRPRDAKSPHQAAAAPAQSAALSSDLVNQLVAAGASPRCSASLRSWCRSNRRSPLTGSPTTRCASSPRSSSSWGSPPSQPAPAAPSRLQARVRLEECAAAGRCRRRSPRLRGHERHWSGHRHL